MSDLWYRYEYRVPCWPLWGIRYIIFAHDRMKQLNTHRDTCGCHYLSHRRHPPYYMHTKNTNNTKPPSVFGSNDRRFVAFYTMDGGRQSSRVQSTTQYLYSIMNWTPLPSTRTRTRTRSLYHRKVYKWHYDSMIAATTILQYLKSLHSRSCLSCSVPQRDHHRDLQFTSNRLDRK